MKRMLHRALHALFRSEFTAQVDAVHTKLRADVARKCAEGKSWQALQENVSLLGMQIDSGSRLKMVFGARADVGRAERFRT